MLNRSLPAAALLCIATACSSGDGETALTAAGTYALTDTTAVVSDGVTRRQALLRWNGAVIDTVDADFGVHVVGTDSLVFLPNPDSADAAHVLFDGSTRVPLADIVPHFDDARSTPAVMDGALLYWGLHHVAGIDSVKAVRYEFRRDRLNMLPLPPMPGSRDSPSYFTQPHLEGREIVFESPAGRWAFRVPRASQ